MGFCVNQLGSRDEAEDAVQSTFLNAHRALQRGVTPEAELAWLFKIAHNVCLTRRRSKRRRVRVEAASDLQAMQDVIPAPARERSDELIRLTDALAHMPDNQRRAILLREWQGLSYHEIADELGLSQSAVETLIFRARRTLAANLEVEPERPSVLARAKGALDIGSLIMLAKGLFEGSAALKATAAAVAISGAAVVATTPPKTAQYAPKAKTTPAVVAPAPSAPRAAVDARGSFFSSGGSARTESPRVRVDRTSSATKQKPAVVLPAPALSERAAPTEAAAFAEAPAAAPAQVPAPAPEQPAPSEKPKKEKPEPPAQTAPPAQGKPDKPKDRDRGKHAEPGPVPVEIAAVIPAESSEPASAPPEQAADTQEKKDKDHGGGNGHRR